MTQNSDVVLRLAAEEDIVGIANIERDSAENPWNEKMLCEELQYSFARLVVAELDNGIVGFANLHIAGGGAHINELAIAPDHRRKGIGLAVVNWCAEEARRTGCDELTLEVRSKNRAAVEMYKKQGFTERGRRFGFYRNPGDDAVTMGLAIQGE